MTDKALRIEFPGLVGAVTNANNIGSRQRSMVLSDSHDVIVTGIMIAAATEVDPGASGNTVIRASDTDYSTAGNGLEASLAAGDTASAAKTTGSLTISAGARLYLYVPSGGAGGGHGDVVAIVDLEEQEKSVT